jgi:hypothetical protein
MKVSEAIRMLSDYDNKDQEIYVEWWDKETAEANAERNITYDQWQDVVLHLEDYEQYHGTSFWMSEKIYELTEEVRTDRTVD